MHPLFLSTKSLVCELRGASRRWLSDLLWPQWLPPASHASSAFGEDWDEVRSGVHDFLSSRLFGYALRKKHLHTKCRLECDSCFNKNFCTRCRAGFYLHLGKCQENCPEGLVRSDTQRECVPRCPAECESCVNSETCTQCRPGLYQLSGRCHHVCPEDYEPSDKLMECTPQVHCEVGEWSEWSPCSHHGRTCGFKWGQETRTRQVLQYPSPFGNPCPEISEIKECLVKRRKCPDPFIDYFPLPNSPTPTASKW
ncbi:R-spondin-3 isoform X1 [Lates japonicus]|uniref:R-spondin-3 isoform X1 n=1 Tax=Lates japonicus TaxID=270547 RepID=A0AAD3M4I9_LATJO|nr:R-spondin-3 isoform X1 [Lates japonicus]